MPTREFPHHPNLAHFKHQAKDLLKSWLSSDAETIRRVRENHPNGAGEISIAPTLTAAQLVIAREYGFASWPKLRNCLCTVESFASTPNRDPDLSGQEENVADQFLRLACLTYGQDHPSRRTKALELWSAHPEIEGSNIFVAAATADLKALEGFLGKEPGLARKRGGPHQWEPLLYLAYARCEPPGVTVDAPACARLLLQKGADPNAGFLWDGGPYLFTALTGVFGEGEAGPLNQPSHPQEMELARLLLDAGADPNDGQALYNRQFTHGATHLEILLRHGLGKKGHGPWMARMGGRLQSPQQMLDDQLLWAAAHNHPDRVTLLLDHGANPHCTRRDGKSAYEVALLHGNPQIAKVLLGRGARKSTLSPAESFAAACNAGDLPAAEALLGKHPGLIRDMSAAATDLLVNAAGENRLATVRMLLKFGVDPSSMSRNSALHDAAWQGNLNIVRYLVEAGANISLCDRSHNATPLEWARYNGKSDVVEYLQSLEGGAE